MAPAEGGQRIRDLRKARGRTLQELARAASLSVSMLSAVERGQKAATSVVLARIADGVGVTVADLVAPRSGRAIVRWASEQETMVEAACGSGAPGARRRSLAEERRHRGSACPSAMQAASTPF